MPALVVVALLLGLAACGGQERSAPLAPVRITLEAPADQATTESEEVEVRGRVTPRDARVLVAGAEADVAGGEFRSVVALQAGANVIDVQAGAPRHPAAMTAVRVVRLVPVEVPELEDLAPDEAAAALEAIGLEADVREAGGLLDDLLPGDLSVCATEPEAGDEVRVGSTVTVLVARGC